MTLKTYQDIVATLINIKRDENWRQQQLVNVPAYIRDAIAIQMGVPAECIRVGVLNPAGQFEVGVPLARERGCEFAVQIDFRMEGNQLLTSAAANFEVQMQAPEYVGYLIQVGDRPVRVAWAQHQKTEDFIEVVEHFSDAIEKQLKIKK